MADKGFGGCIEIVGGGVEVGVDEFEDKWMPMFSASLTELEVLKGKPLEGGLGGFVSLISTVM